MREKFAGEKILRNRSVKILNGKHDSNAVQAPEDPEKLIEELRIHQIELEMQNEDLRLAQAKLETIQNKYVDLYEFAPVGYFTLGETGNIVEVNLTAAKLLGLNKAHIIGRQLTDFVEREFQDTLYFYLRKIRDSENKESCELKIRKFSDEPFFAHLEGVAVCHKKSAPIEFRISLINIHEKKKIEIALKASADNNEMLLNLLPQSAILLDLNQKVLVANDKAIESEAETDATHILCSRKNQHRLNGSANKTGEYTLQKTRPSIPGQAFGNPHQQRLVTVIEDSNDAVSLLDLQGNIKAWNRKAEEMYGYPASDALKMSIFDLAPANLKNATRQLLTDIRNGLLIKPFETRRIARDGSVLDVCLTFTRIIQGNKILAIATTERDVTDHNRWFASLQELPRRIIIAQEKERSRISQVLHAEFGQSLIALKLFTFMADSEVPEQNLQVKSAFNKIKINLDKIINDARNLAHELSPPGLKYVGLGAAIKDLVKSAMQKKNLSVRFFHRNMNQACFKKKDIIIYRLVQEALQNIFKHSQATRARVIAIFKNSIFTLEISDNGIGFNPSGKTSSSGLGLALMKEQAALINGTLSVESREGKGTSVKVRIPIKEKKKP